VWNIAPSPAHIIQDKLSIIDAYSALQMSCDILAGTGFVRDKVATLDSELTEKLHKYQRKTVKQVWGPDIGQYYTESFSDANDI